MLSQIARPTQELQRQETWTPRLSQVSWIYSPACVCHDSNSPFSGKTASVNQLIAMLGEAFPDLKLTVEQILLEEETAAVRWKIEGTHLGSLPEIAPTWRKINITGMSFLRFEHGQVVEEWTEWDALSMLEQLGLVNWPVHVLVH
ncbi:MAG TPA: ester cyclase [Chloroflexia bacterium]|nr:ester cyclase [Chloroflexia bacterium]